MHINNQKLQDLSEMYESLYEGKFVPGKTKLRPRSERSARTQTPKERETQRQEENRRKELEFAADNILAGLQSGSRPKTSEKSKEDESTPQGKVRRLPKGQKRDMTAAAANEIIRQLQNNSYEYEGELLDERKRREPRWWDDPNQLSSASDLIDLDHPNYQYVAARLLMFSLRKSLYGQMVDLPHLEDHIYDCVSRELYDSEIFTKYSKEEIDKVNSFI